MWYSFRPYVSAAQRRAKAAREVANRMKSGLKVSPVHIEGRSIARTFWGQAWCTNLESYSDFSNRLPRGRTYVRNGSVVHLEIEPGKAKALVSGSELYEVKIDMGSVGNADWSRIKSLCAGQIGSLIELLQGRLSKAVMDVVTSRDGGLFPKPREIKMACSCPDWAGMCKHIAAVLYGIGARLDNQPELLFILRGVDHLELIEDAIPTFPQKPAGLDDKKTLNQSEIADVFGIEFATSEPPAAPETPKAPHATSKKKKPGKQPTVASKSAAPARVRASKSRPTKTRPTAAKHHHTRSEKSPKK